MAKYIKVVDGQPVEYSLGKLRLDNPNTSFPKWPDAEILKEHDVYAIRLTDKPVATIYKNVAEGTPQLVDGQWTQVWDVTDASDEEIAERKEARYIEVEKKRLKAYQEVSDPLFFKWQRGEATEQEWLQTVAQIKEWYPHEED